MILDINTTLDLLRREVEGYRTPVVDLIAVQTRDPYKVLVATILSARTRDEVTAKAAARLFQHAPDLKELARLSEAELEKLIHPVGFFRTKAKHLARLTGAMEELFGGRIPDEVEPLTRLPGVGRKTANLVVAVAFDKPAICVDTHVHRIMNIWGYVETKTPLETEMTLRGKLPARHWRTVNSILVAFGQELCRPRLPHCDRCPIAAHCPKLGVTPRRVAGAKTASPAGEMKKFISWNVNGIRAIAQKGFADIVNELDADIIALQEIKAQPDQLTDDLKNLPGYHSFWFAAQRKGYAGVAIYARAEPRRVLYGLGHDGHDGEGRVLTLEYDDFYFVTAYFPNAQHGLTRLDYKLAFNRDLHAFVHRLAGEKSVVLCGDLNVAHQEIDLTNPRQNEKNPGFTMEERQWMDHFLGSGYLDTFRMFNREPGQYTWWSYRFNARAKNIGWRIDYFCVDEKSKARVKGAAILAGITGSDHCPVQLDFA
ncbi:MAG: exodeoxyribonuclease III [Desulfobulbaceae bacterium]|nr:exodeoxyribonuclease III [Desulfobulbaceae bacterium]